MNVISLGFSRNTIEATRVNIIFFVDKAQGINLRDNDPLVITTQYGSWDIRLILIYPGSSINVLF